jgi:hypothetical protein
MAAVFLLFLHRLLPLLFSSRMGEARGRERHLIAHGWGRRWRAAPRWATNEVEDGRGPREVLHTPRESSPRFAAPPSSDAKQAPQLWGRHGLR